MQAAGAGPLGFLTRCLLPLPLVPGRFSGLGLSARVTPTARLAAVSLVGFVPHC